VSSEPGAQRIRSFGTTVFSEFSALAAEHGAVNLGQGFPDFDGPAALAEAAGRAMGSGLNQYAITHGADALRAAVAAHAQRFYGQRVDASSEVTVTSGATEAIFDTVLAVVDPGDEVVLFEPFYDSYLGSVQMAGGVPRFVRLHPPDESHQRWWFDPKHLARAFSPRTRLVIVNTPHNPTGKVFERGEFEQLGTLCTEYGAWLLSDEVYEHLVYPEATMLRPATLPSLAARTVTVSSAGKSFSITGWKVGWAIAPPTLTQSLRKVHQFVTFATATPLQAAVAEALLLPDSYFERLREDYISRRDRWLGELWTVGLAPWVPEGSYFALSDLRGRGVGDVEFCRALTTQAGVAAIPLSPFYGPGEPPPPPLARFAFCKRRETLDAAAKRLRQWAGV
jgi:N-succinyldiaminopimelate aminotransferase